MMQQHEDPSITGPSPFEEGVTQILILNEELKQSLNASTADESLVVQWQTELEVIVERLDFLFRMVLDAPGDDMKQDLYQHVHQKTKATCLTVLQHVATMDVEEQAAVARIVELALMIHNNMSTQTENNNEYATQVMDIYVAYQRFVLRHRSKPAIAYLAQWRQQDEDSRNAVTEQEEEEDEETTHIARPHSHAMTVILGQASALIHPLVLWKNGLTPNADLAQMCETTIQVLNEQAQTLTKTVSDWFWVDRKVLEWMSQVAAMDGTEGNPTVDLVELDTLVEEMAFCSQLLARYQTLLHNATISTKLIQDELLPEWTWKYASLERFLARQQWKSALNMACPVSIVMGLPIQVPSVVEDAQYLSTRALERATLTLSQQAMGTVAHSISHDIWSTDMDGGVYQALIDQRGCWAHPEQHNKSEMGNSKEAPASNGGGSSTFASALLGALDEDLGTSTVSPPSSKSPASGSFLGALVGEGKEQQQMRLDMQLCQLNGIYSASVACTSLSQSIDEDTETGDGSKTSSMIQLAREELLRYANAYQVFLTDLILEVIHEWCGSLRDTAFQDGKCIHSLRHFFLYETYELNEATFAVAEADERLERELLVPLKESRLVENLSKCDTEVTFLVCKELSSLIAQLVLDYLWRDKRFTDWGSLLLSKQVRMLQLYLSSLVEEQSAIHAGSLLKEWKRMTQVVTLLQLEKPSDWIAYRDDNHVLTKEEVKKTLSLRIDFPSDAIAAVCGVRKGDEKDNDQADKSSDTNGRATIR